MSSSCLNCHRVFKSQKGLQSHYQQQQECNNHFLKYGLQIANMDSPNKVTMAIQPDNDDTFNDEKIEQSNDNGDEFFENYAFNNSLIDQTIKKRYNHHLQSGFTNLIENNSLIQSQVDLLVLLKQARAPIYLFDQIWKWTEQSVNMYKIDFGSLGTVSRTNCITNLKKILIYMGLIL